jgi:transcription repressor NrdR-like protein
MIDSRHCAQCGQQSDVIDSRPTQHGFIRRRRMCPACQCRWTTLELHMAVYEALAPFLEGEERLDRVAAQLEHIAGDLRLVFAAVLPVEGDQQ